MDITLFVCNLPPSVDEVFLRNIFSRYGDVSSVKLVRERGTNKSKGYGFVRINERDSENALQHLNGFIIKGSKITVKYDNKLNN